MYTWIDVNYINDAPKWEESKHPRGSAGGGHGGQFVKKGMGGGGAVPKMAKVNLGKFIEWELKKGTSLSELANKLKDATKEHINKQYVDKIFGQMEKKHGLPKGSLKSGYGVTQYKPSQPAVKPTPPPPQPTPIQQPGAPTTTQQIASILAQQGKTSFTKAKEVAELVKDKPDGIKSVAFKVLAKLESDVQATPGAFTGLLQMTPGASKTLPQPYDTPHQKALYAIATNPNLSATEKAAQIQHYPTVQNYPQQFAAKYAKQLVEALGENWINPDPGPMPSPSPTPSHKPTPTPTPPPAPTPSTIILSGNKPWHKKLRDRWDKAFVPTSNKWDQKNAEQCFESAKPGEYSKYSAKSKQAISSYTGAGYGSMNDALRDPTTAGGHTLSQVDAVLEAFEEDQSVVTKDVKLWRGTHYDAKEIAKMKAAVKLGLPYTAKLDGFTSCSFFKDQPAEIGANKPYWFEIVATKGSRAVAAKLGSSIPEGEILLEHEQNYRVLEVTENWQSPAHGKKTRIRVITVSGGSKSHGGDD